MTLPKDWRLREYPSLDLTGLVFEQVIEMNEDFKIFDFTQGYEASDANNTLFGIGRYDEHRPGMYMGDQFTEDTRDLHIGIDIAAPAGTSVHAFYAGTIFALGDNDLAYDYGPTIITQHILNGLTVYALHGHLSRESLRIWRPGDSFTQGDILAKLGDKTVNGGWAPHLHFQLSLLEPLTHDLPGTVNLKDREFALRAFPDPRLVLGDLY